MGQKNQTLIKKIIRLKDNFMNLVHDFDTNTCACKNLQFKTSLHYFGVLQRWSRSGKQISSRKIFLSLLYPAVMCTDLLTFGIMP